jgi:hypothetical protein
LLRRSMPIAFPVPGIINDNSSLQPLERERRSRRRAGSSTPRSYARARSPASRPRATGLEAQRETTVSVSFAHLPDPESSSLYHGSLRELTTMCAPTRGLTPTGLPPTRSVPYGTPALHFFRSQEYRGADPYLRCVGRLTPYSPPRAAPPYIKQPAFRSTRLARELYRSDRTPLAATLQAHCCSGEVATRRTLVLP